MSDDQNNRPIGVFDSGLGGLTVLAPLIDRLPNESTIYLGDLERTPYGDKKPQDIIKYAVEGVEFLLSQNIKALVIACNSASSVALPDIFARSTVPVFDVIAPGAKMAIKHSRSRAIGVLGTDATINSDVYSLELKSQDVNVSVHQKACPKLAPMIERGSAGVDAFLSIVRDYIRGLPFDEIDTVILGCTHYPIIKEVFNAACGDEVRLVDSGHATAEHLASELQERGLLTNATTPGEHRYFVTTASDNPATDRFHTLAERFLGRSIDQLDTVNLSASPRTPTG